MPIQESIAALLRTVDQFVRAFTRGMSPQQIQSLGSRAALRRLGLEIAHSDQLQSEVNQRILMWGLPEISRLVAIATHPNVYAFVRAKQLNLDTIRAWGEGETLRICGIANQPSVASFISMRQLDLDMIRRLGEAETLRLVGIANQPHIQRFIPSEENGLGMYDGWSINLFQIYEWKPRQLAVANRDYTNPALNIADLSELDLRMAQHFVDQATSLQGVKFPKANLRGISLKGKNLQGADLSNCDLTLADLSGANLQGANLSGATLKGANLSGAYLQDAKLSGVTIGSASRGILELWQKTRFLGADLRNTIELPNSFRRHLAAIEENINIGGHSLPGDGMDLQGARVDGFNWKQWKPSPDNEILPQQLLAKAHNLQARGYVQEAQVAKSLATDFQRNRASFFPAAEEINLLSKFRNPKIMLAHTLFWIINVSLLVEGGMLFSGSDYLFNFSIRSDELFIGTVLCLSALLALKLKEKVTGNYVYFTSETGGIVDKMLQNSRISSKKWLRARSSLRGPRQVKSSHRLIIQKIMGR